MKLVLEPCEAGGPQLYKNVLVAWGLIKLYNRILHSRAEIGKFSSNVEECLVDKQQYNVNPFHSRCERRQLLRNHSNYFSPMKICFCAKAHILQNHSSSSRTFSCIHFLFFAKCKSINISFASCPQLPAQHCIQGILSPGLWFSWQKKNSSSSMCIYKDQKRTSNF